MFKSWKLKLSDEARFLWGAVLFIAAFILLLFLLAKILYWLILIISPRVLDIGCSGILLLIIWVSAIVKSRLDIRTNGHDSTLGWLGSIFATLLFIAFYKYVGTLDTKGQIGCGYGLFIVVLLIISSKSPPPRIENDDEDDYHASR